MLQEGFISAAHGWEDDESIMGRYRVWHYKEILLASCSFAFELPPEGQHKGFYCTVQQSKSISILLKIKKSLNSRQQIDLCQHMH